MALFLQRERDTVNDIQEATNTTAKHKQPTRTALWQLGKELRDWRHRDWLWRRRRQRRDNVAVVRRRRAGFERVVVVVVVVVAPRRERRSCTGTITMRQVMQPQQQRQRQE